MSRLDELKREIEELEAKSVAQEQNAGEPADGLDIPADDPEVLAVMKGGDHPGVREVWPELARPKTLTEARQIVAEQRKQEALKARTGDESLPVAERVQAAREWRAGLPTGNTWEQFSEQELPERLARHPHFVRLREAT